MGQNLPGAFFSEIGSHVERQQFLGVLTVHEIVPARLVLRYRSQ
jgi:hypothetical protein